MTLPELTRSPRLVAARAFPLLLTALGAACGGGGATTPDSGEVAAPESPSEVTVAGLEPQTVGSTSFGSSTRLSVSWAAPSTGTAAAYQVTAAESGGHTVTETVAAGATGVTLAALKAGTTYSVTVSACADVACATRSSASPVSGATSGEVWQLVGSPGAKTTAGLTRIVSDGNAKVSATRFGPEAGGATADRVQLYYGPSNSGRRQVLSTALTTRAPTASDVGSWSQFTSHGAATGLASPPTPTTWVSVVSTGQGVPLSSALGARVRLFFEAQGADGKTRIFSIDSVDGYVGQDFNSGAAVQCAAAADYAPGGGCAVTTLIGVQGDAINPVARLNNVRQHKVGYPTLTDWRWDGAPGTFMVFTFDAVNGCTTAFANHGYAVWDGSTWGVQTEASGCPKAFKSAQAAYPIHLGGVRYKMVYGDVSITTGKLTGSTLPFLGPKKLIYADGAATGAADRVDFEDWESTAAGRTLTFLWPSGDALTAGEAGYIDDYAFVAPTGTLDLQVMYMAITNGTEIPFGAAARLLNP